MNHFFGVDLVSSGKRAMRHFYSVQRESAGLFLGNVGLALAHFHQKLSLLNFPETLMHMNARGCIHIT